VAAALATVATGGVGAGSALADGSGRVGTARSAASARLPGVGHDASFKRRPCWNPLVAGFPVTLPKRLKCGYLTVPENRNKLSGPKIRIAVAIAPARTRRPKADPLLWLEGGPGGSGLSVATSILAKGINADRDVVFVDQRGTLKSQPLLGCANYDEFAFKSVDQFATDPRTGREDVSAVRACYRKWIGQGIDVSSFNTPENAADMADLRIALHLKRWNVYGVSYGTDLALQLVRDYPQGIRTEVLDSVVPPQVNLANEFWPAAADGFRAVFRSCDATPSCRAAYPHLPRDLTTAVNRLNRKPLKVGVLNPATGQPATVAIDGFQFPNLLVTFSLTPGSFEQLPALIHEMAQRQAPQSGLRLVPGGVAPGLSGIGLAFTVFCGESVAYTTPAQALARARKVLPGFPARVLSLTPQIPHLFAECNAWRVRRVNPAARTPAHTNIPVLELSGDFDAITPFAWARLAARTMRHARIVRFRGIGHGAITWSQCGADITVGFLDRPRGGYSTSCAARLPNPL
jgi:pimeloyl-ACP methyl ester carboxylesterase